MIRIVLFRSRMKTPGKSCLVAGTEKMSNHLLINELEKIDVLFTHIFKTEINYSVIIISHLIDDKLISTNLCRYLIRQLIVKEEYF